jgi:NAD(P)-dependent dehydrogenase (short-subunit alcohol dehydrogenase family)
VSVVCDLTDPAAIERALGGVESAFGGLELVVNNAGTGYRARVAELDPALVRRVLETNVSALLLVCRAALPLLVRGTAPVVVNVASVVGRRGIPGQAVYSASKAAVCSIGEALRVEWAEHGIAVCTLNPGLTATGFFEAQPNPAGLDHPDLATAQGADDVAREVLALDRRPRPERSLRSKWRWLALLSIAAPRLSDRMLVKRLGGGWRAPRRCSRRQKPGASPHAPPNTNSACSLRLRGAASRSCSDSGRSSGAPGWPSANIATGSWSSGIPSTSRARAGSKPPIACTRRPRDSASKIRFAVASPTSCSACRFDWPVFMNARRATESPSTGACVAHVALPGTRQLASRSNACSSSRRATKNDHGWSL